VGNTIAHSAGANHCDVGHLFLILSCKDIFLTIDFNKLNFMNKFHIWGATNYNGKFGAVGHPINLSKSQQFKLLTGDFSADEFSQTIKFESNGKLPLDTMVTDTKSVIVSERLKSFLISLNLEGLRFLPCDVGGKSNYSVLQSSSLLSVLDMNESQLSWSINHPKLLRSLGPRFIERNLPEGPAIFRIKEYPYYHLVSESVVKKLDEAKFTGLKWTNFIMAEKCWFIDSFVS
jgi:hypothetical protein